MKPVSTRPHVPDLLRHLDTVIERDLNSIPPEYVGKFRSSYRSPRPLTDLVEKVAPPQSGYTSETVRQLVNTALQLETFTAEPATLTKRPDANSKDWLAVNTSGCEDAEPNFDLAYHQLLDPNLPDLPPHLKLSAYHDTSGDAMFVRKTYKSPTALSLQAVQTEEGLILPPGTIVGMNSVRPESITGSANLLRGDHQAQLLAIEFDPNLDTVAPLRLSAWAFRQIMDQAIFATSRSFRGGYMADRTRLDIILSRSLDDFRVLGNEILDICGVR